MSTFTVVGAGGIGRGAAAALASEGHGVTLVSRSGTDPELGGVRSAAVDATDPTALAAIAEGSAAIINAMNPRRYTTWARDWPPAAAAMLTAAERTGAGLVTVSNLYLYGRVDAPTTEQTRVAPNGIKGRVRAQMWADALVAHRAGRVRATELRASDYFGPGSSPSTSVLNVTVIDRVISGKRPRLLFGDADAPHTWTYLPDIGRFAATLATDERSWGEAWHVPSAEPRTTRQVAADVADLLGQPAPEIGLLPRAVLTLGRIHPLVREFDETRHQFERPFVMDSSAAQGTFGFAPTPWQQAIAESVSGVRDRVAVG